MPFTPQELEAMRAADAEIEATFCMTQEDIQLSRELDREARLDSLPPEKRKRAIQAMKAREREKERFAQRDAAYYRSHKEQKLQKRRDYKEQHKDQISASQKSWYQRHREEILEARRVKYQQNREEILKKQREYQHAHKERYAEYRRNSRRKKKQKMEAMKDAQRAGLLPGESGANP